MAYDIKDLGAKTRGNSVTFRLKLPQVDPDSRVLVIGSFCNWEPERGSSLRYDSKEKIWKTTIDDLDRGLHEYAFVIKTASWYSNRATDPYAKMTGPNGYSAFVIPSEKPARLDSFTPPNIEDLILYEINLDNFNKNFEGVMKRVISYLSQLGINGVIFSPWVGYDHNALGEKIPVHYFAPDYSYGTPYDLKVMINECHKAGIAVIMDIDLEAVSPLFGINQMYSFFDIKPIIGKMDDAAKKIYINYADKQAQEFVYEVCRWWLDEYNIDGIRFLKGGNYWDGPDGEALSLLTNKIHEYAQKTGRNIYLFAKHCQGRQVEMLKGSHINGVFNHRFFKSIHLMAENRTLPSDFWKCMDLNQLNYPEEIKIKNKAKKCTSLNAIEDGEHHSLIVKLGVISGKRDHLGYPVGDRRNHWWKIKPYIIAQFTSNGIPLIYNGTEIGHAQYIPEYGPYRFAPRPIGWQYMADFAGKDLFRFHQKLIHLRTHFASLRSRNFFHYFTDPTRQFIVFKRYLDDEVLVVAINFSNESTEVEIPFPSDGIWREYLDDFDILVKGRKAKVRVPARYGAIFYRE